jgi:hypothetical protein
MTPTEQKEERKEDYRAVAKELGVHHLFWRYGLQLLPIRPDGKPYKLLSIVRLDGWILDPYEVDKFMRERGGEL